MFFYFIKYVSPGWYYNLVPKGNLNYFPDYNTLNPEFKSNVQFDQGFSSYDVQLLDASFQAWRNGIVYNDTNSIKTDTINPTVEDNYRFIRKYYHPNWSFYILLLRILSFHNPLKEINFFFKQRKTQRQNKIKNYSYELQYGSFESDIIKQNPKIAVIIPTLNRYEYLNDVLFDLEKQTYTNFEVIIIDQSDEYRPDFYRQFKLNIKLIRQQEKGLWKARNSGVVTSDTDFLLFTEDDVRFKQDLIYQHIKCIDFFSADISTGVFYPQDTIIPGNRSYFKYAEQFSSGNACVKRHVFNEVGLFDLQFERQRMGDGEFGLRAYLAGFKSISNPYASCIDIKAPTGGLRQFGSWDSFRPVNLFAPRPIPSVLYLFRRYFGNSAAICMLVQNTLPSIIPYRFKHNKKYLWMGILLGILTLPFLFIQVYRSWHIGSQMIKAGPRISFL